jgi:hypothetical protein
MGALYRNWYEGGGGGGIGTSVFHLLSSSDLCFYLCDDAARTLQGVVVVVGLCQLRDRGGEDGGGQGRQGGGQGRQGGGEERQGRRRGRAQQFVVAAVILVVRVAVV